MTASQIQRGHAKLLLLISFFFLTCSFADETGLDVIDDKIQVHRKSGEKDVILFANIKTNTPELRLIASEILEKVQFLMKRKRNIFPILEEEMEDFDVPLQIKDFDEFRDRKIDYIITGFLYSRGDDYIYKMFIWDIYERKKILEEDFSIPHTEMKNFSPKMATKIYEFITGEYGFFYGKLLYTVTEREGVFPFKRVALSKKEGTFINAVLYTEGTHITINPTACKFEIMYAMQTKKEGLNLFIVNRETGHNERLRIGDYLTEKPSKTSVYSPNFSANCQKIIFSMIEETGSNIYLFDRQKNELKKLTNTKNAINTSPVFSKKEDKIYFISDRNKKPRLFEMNANGGNAKQLTSGNGFYFAPQVSSDGEKIVFVNSYSGMFHLKILDLKTGKENILYSAFLIEDPTFAPSGNTVLFSMKKSAKDFSRIYFLSLNGNGEPQELEALKGFLNEPRWIEEF